MLSVMSRRPTPPGGYGSQGEDFTYLRTVEGHKVKPWDSGGGIDVDTYQNAATHDDIFSEGE